MSLNKLLLPQEAHAICLGDRWFQGFYFMDIYTACLGHFRVPNPSLPIDSFVPDLALKQRFGATRKWPIGQLHDDVILLQLPESFSLLFSCAN